VKARYLVDKSALARMPVPAVRERLGPIIEAGQAATCAIIDLEILYSTRNHREHAETRHRRSLAYTSVAIDDSVLQRAIDMQGELAKSGSHRVPLPDLIIAAAAERHDLIVLHYDADFDRIAEVSKQATEWVVPQGSV
jgi:hypothetical protein